MPAGLSGSTRSHCLYDLHRPFFPGVLMSFRTCRPHTSPRGTIGGWRRTRIADFSAGGHRPAPRRGSSCQSRAGPSAARDCAVLGCDLGGSAPSSLMVSATSGASIRSSSPRHGTFSATVGGSEDLGVRTLLVLRPFPSWSCPRMRSAIIVWFLARPLVASASTVFRTCA